MLRLFRHVRQRLLLEGRVSRYFGYAVGEVVLIVVGILIALQISEWNQARADEKLKDSYIARLIENIQSDIASFETQIRLNELGVGLSEFLMQAAQDPEIVRDRPVEFMAAVKGRIAVQGPLFSDTYQDLLSTGNMGLLEDGLKKAIFSYYQLDARFRQGATVEEDVPIQYSRLRRGILTNEQVAWLDDRYRRATQGNIEAIKADTYDTESVIEAAYRLQENTELVQILPEMRFSFLRSIGRSNARMDRANELLEALQEEFEN